ncbi:MAG: hypothetical protein US42_C0008G0099 [Candidatus Magasanikbacteria bacterium GW2011_GWC2_37_14]|uniref:Uncharacterized protein n=1 Tax=Candidatus Magasanikbacteria bacterium GW2011_GWC2_37_14 TaxID=1619046 RepID=A0A0G0JHL5_9BACT|nr:MAG: hypothetical protein US42_C0008G0099 [Candidatus Magasanikbacteria bacterium GW2011_GWC2_37_14]
MPSVLVVREEDLKRCPKAFRDYVSEFFARYMIWGVRVRYAATYSFEPSGGYRKGHAPSHSVELARFTEGLAGQSLNSWMNQAARQDIVLHIPVGQHASGSSWADDD